MGGTRRHRLISFGLFGSMLLPLVLAFSAVSPADADDETFDPVDILVLVDESASLSSAAVRAEKAALREIIASSELEDRGIRIGVLPFSSGTKSPRNVDDCKLAEIGGPRDGRVGLNRCADQIVRQNKRGSADTDFASAISGALRAFDRSNASKVMLLLTDGKYDPDGNEIISEKEQNDLDRVLERANQEKVTMWALGFGKADRTALDEYVAKTSAGDPSCTVKPEAVLASEVELSDKLRRIVQLATCTGEIQGKTPFKFAVSPFFSQITIEVADRGRRVESSDVRVTDAFGDDVCLDGAVIGNRWTCKEKIGGDDGGIWIVSSTSGEELDVLATWTGAIKIAARECVISAGVKPTTYVEVLRSDDQEVNYDVDGELQWPRVSVQVSSEGVNLRNVTLDLDQQKNAILGIDEAPVGAEIEISLMQGSADDRLVIKTSQISNCSLVNSKPPATTSSVTTQASSSTSTIATSIDDNEPECKGIWDCNKWLIVLLGALVAGLSVVVTRLRGSRRFPDGSQLERQNARNGAVYELVEEIGGQRKVFFDVIADGSSGSIEIVSNKRDARYLLVREDDSAVRITSLYRFEDQQADEDSENDGIDESVEMLDDRQALLVLNNEPFNVRECDPTAAPDKAQAIMLKVSIPENFNEGDMS